MGDNILQNLRRYASVSLLDNNVIASSVIINNASLSDGGKYTVTAVNIAGSKQMTFQLEVSDSPRFTVPILLTLFLNKAFSFYTYTISTDFPRHINTNKGMSASTEITASVRQDSANY